MFLIDMDLHENKLFREVIDSTCIKQLCRVERQVGVNFLLFGCNLLATVIGCAKHTVN